jgi:hypothetical protein
VLACGHAFHRDCNTAFSCSVCVVAASQGLVSRRGAGGDRDASLKRGVAGRASATSATAPPGAAAPQSQASSGAAAQARDAGEYLHRLSAAFGRAPASFLADSAAKYAASGASVAPALDRRASARDRAGDRGTGGGAGARGGAEAAPRAPDYADDRFDAING